VKRKQRYSVHYFEVALHHKWCYLARDGSSGAVYLYTKRPQRSDEADFDIKDPEDDFMELSPYDFNLPDIPLGACWQLR